MPDDHATTIIINGCEVFALRIPAACNYLGCGRSQLYDDLQRGVLEAVKSGTRTLVTAESLIRRARNLPKATFRPLKPRNKNRKRPAPAQASSTEGKRKAPAPASAAE